MRRTEKEKPEKKVKHLIIELKTEYPNLYNSIGGRYVRRLLTDMSK